MSIDAVENSRKHKESSDNSNGFKRSFIRLFWQGRPTEFCRNTPRSNSFDPWCPSINGVRHGIDYKELAINLIKLFRNDITFF